jgi:predicted secreted acid phosphatase
MEKTDTEEWVCVFVEGTILDDRHRLSLPNQGFDRLDLVKKDRPVAGAAETLNKVAEKYKILYLSTRKPELHQLTRQWIKENGFPEGEIYFGETLEKRLELVRRIKTKEKIVAGIGDRWDDNLLHLEIGLLSIILKEYEGDWKIVEKHLLA